MAPGCGFESLLCHFPVCVTLSKSLNLPKPQFSVCKTRIMMGFYFYGLSVTPYLKHSTQGLVPGKT